MKDDNFRKWFWYWLGLGIAIPLAMIVSSEFWRLEVDDSVGSLFILQILNIICGIFFLDGKRVLASAVSVLLFLSTVTVGVCCQGVVP